MKKIIFNLLFFEIALIFLLGCIYTVSQQNIRLSANALPAELAQETINRLKNGLNVNQATDLPKIELESSLSPFVMVFDSAGNLLESNTTLAGKAPAIPVGILKHTKTFGEDRVTWQPEPGVRLAIVAKAFAKGFVVAGHSLQEYENRDRKILQLTALAILFGTVGNVLFYCLQKIIKE